ncbi:MAG TPA: class I SAM-dependent methyltransferase [Terriglobales bacterium]|nr:class I SAM-dependent methyltransferase [Terriglobales bacterium]
MATPELIRKHYDSLALIYRAFWGDHIHHGLFESGKETPPQAQTALLRYCLELLRPAAGCSVLDVGCGHGGTAAMLASELGAEVLGLTLSEKQARIARENARCRGVEKQTTFVVQDAETYAYPVACFDVVWTMESSEHFAHKQRYFQNAAAALKPGGRLLLTAWTGSMQRARVRAVAAAFLCPELWTCEQYRNCISGCGLAMLHCRDLTAKVVRTWEICRRRARAAALALGFLPKGTQALVEGMDTIADAYRAGDLSYTVMVAGRATVQD